jgi:hypothetical protein
MATISLRDLCESIGIDPHTARIKLRANEIAKASNGAYKWEDTSEELYWAKQVLILDPQKPNEAPSE